MCEHTNNKPIHVSPRIVYAQLKKNIMDVNTHTTDPQDRSDPEHRALVQERNLNHRSSSNSTSQKRTAPHRTAPLVLALVLNYPEETYNTTTQYPNSMRTKRRLRYLNQVLSEKNGKKSHVPLN